MKLKDIFNFQINEAPEVGDNDMYDDKVTDIELKHVSEIAHYIKLGNFTALNKKIYLYQKPNEFNYVFGFIKNGIFNEYGSITLLPRGNFLGYNNVHEVDEIEVANDARGKGLSTKLYRFLVLKLKMNLMCGELQFHGARLLWRNLSRQPDMAVDVVDMNTPKIIEKNAILKHGQNNDEFDPRYWDTFPSAAKFDGIRFIMRPKIN